MISNSLAFCQKNILGETIGIVFKQSAIASIVFFLILWEQNVLGEGKSRLGKCPPPSRKPELSVFLSVIQGHVIVLFVRCIHLGICPSCINTSMIWYNAPNLATVYCLSSDVHFRQQIWILLCSAYSSRYGYSGERYQKRFVWYDVSTI